MFNSKSSVLLIALVSVFVLASCAELYSDKYDHIDVDGILANPRLREQYYKCFAGSLSHCLTADAKFFRERMREAILTNCSKCTERQRIAFDKISIFYAENEPEKYKALVAGAIKAGNN